MPATFRLSGVAAALLLLPGLVASEFPPTRTLPASLALTATCPAQRGSSLTHWLPRGASPFASAVWGPERGLFRPSSLPARAPAELSCLRRSGASHMSLVAAPSCLSRRQPNRSETAAQGDRASSESGCASSAQMLPGHTEAARRPAPACALLPGAQLGPQLPHPHPRAWRWNGSLAQKVAWGYLLGYARAAVNGVALWVASTTPGPWRATRGPEHLWNPSVPSPRRLPSPTATPAVLPEHWGPLGL